MKVFTSDDDLSLPFILRRVIGREYHIGPDGATIGSSFKCSIQVPIEGEAWPEHCHIKYIHNLSTSAKDNNKSPFVLFDLTDGSGSTYVTHNGYSLEAISEENGEETDEGKTFPLTLSHGVRFATGRFVWDLTALPEDVVFRAKMFHLAERNSLSQMKKMLEDQNTMPRLAIIGSYNTCMIAYMACLIDVHVHRCMYLYSKTFIVDTPR